jgi:hypothetical protein
MINVGACTRDRVARARAFLFYSHCLNLKQGPTIKRIIFSHSLSTPHVTNTNHNNVANTSQTNTKRYGTQDRIPDVMEADRIAEAPE